MTQSNLPAGKDSRGANNRIDIIGAVTQPLGFFVLSLLAAESIIVALTVAVKDSPVRVWLVGGGFSLILLSMISVFVMAFFRPESLYHRNRPVVVEKRPPRPERTTAGDRLKLPGEDNPAPPAGVWYDQIRPVLHQAIHYTVPTYYLDTDLNMVDWNIAFDLVFSKLGGRLRDKHVLNFINELENFDEVMGHAQEFTRQVDEGRIPFIDVEPLVYASEKYGEVRFSKVAAQLHGPDGIPRGWSVSLIIREIGDGDSFIKDLLDEARKDKLWGVYSASYDRVLLEYEPYQQLIKDVTGVVSGTRKSVVDLGAGTGNTTKALLAAEHSVTAVENNLGMLDRLRAKRLAGKLTVVKSSVESLTTLADQSFDAAVMVNVLYAVDDPLACLQGVSRILKPNGVLGLSTTHSRTQLDRLLGSIKARLKEKGQFDRLAADYQVVYDANKAIEKDIATRYSRDDYRNWVKAAGFAITRDVPEAYEGAVMLIWAQKTA
jgi:ubiquinone/menaquinone biosynthesis C-methylase UbiE